MPSIPVDSQSASNILSFSIGLIALMQAGVWYAEREPGLPWFAAASLLSALLVAKGSGALTVSAPPDDATLLAMYAIRCFLALGLTSYLGLAGRTRSLSVAALILPAVAFTFAFLGGIPFGRLPAPLPLLWADIGLSLLCLAGARREPGAGHDLLALAPMMGPGGILLDLWRGPGPHLNQDFPANMIGFGIIILVAGLLRKSRASRRAQALAQRMSNYYAALSHTNQAILRIKEPAALFDEVCRICVQWGHVKMACVYEADGDLTRRVASAGPVGTFLEGSPDQWDMTSPDAAHSNTVRALKEGERIVCDDYQNDLRSGHRRERRAGQGVNSFAWLPLRRNSQVIAVLMLVAEDRPRAGGKRRLSFGWGESPGGPGSTREAGFFDRSLIGLLDEMTQDISVALDNIDRDTRHAEAAREVQAGLERFARLFETAPVAAAIITLAGRRIVDVNQSMCERYGLLREQMVGRTTVTLPYQPDSVDREAFYALLNKDGRVRSFAIQMRDERGRSRTDLLNAETIAYLGQPCYLLMSLDITELRAAQEARQALAEAEAASSAKTQFLSRMSHELRTPLNAVIGFSGLLRRDAAARLTAQDLAQLDHVQQAGWHLVRLIDDVLDLSRIEAGQFGVNARGLELAPVLDEALQMSQPLAAKAGVALHADYHDEAPIWALADPTRLRQVVLNVVSNAIKFNRPQGSVRVRAMRRGDGAAIEVTDTGLGMSEQQLAHLFEPFNRLGRERHGIEGTGIGLSLTRQLMQLMNGDVDVSSEEGRGTHVTLTLPGADGPQEPTAAVGDRTDGASPVTAEPVGTVLYIEDNANNTYLVEQMLADWEGVHFVAARDGATGIQMALALRPDLVLLDLQLPDLDGLEVLGRLRDHEALGTTPIVVLSASAMPDSITQARSRGATDYWTKPLDFERFLAGVATLLPRAGR